MYKLHKSRLQLALPHSKFAFKLSSWVAVSAVSSQFGNYLNGSCAQGRKFGDTVVVDLSAILSIPEFVAWLESVETPSFEGSVCANKRIR